MNKDQAKGKGEELVGKVKKGAGDLAGNENLKAHGEAEELKGKARQKAGNVEEGAHDMADRAKRAARDMQS